ncbi:HAD family hydrolase [Vibrio quintilis]|uniref:Pyrimidine 5'-nucleotidase YjjG n=1 Tax=Vibrio quintilis TaxID=1117707 RepID=A0A1M7YRA7_9VIBR|nr:HAD family hydrolase [Vibrio quintilis]SHO55172.1 Pyrimidine 5'-nucleotidase YjjG [Vibrio quintilis]
MRLIFDLDNTLIDRDAAFIACIKSLFSQYRDTLSADELAEICMMDGSGRIPRVAFCQALQKRFVFLPRCYEDLWAHFRCLPRWITPDLQVNQMLGRLSRQHTLVLLSNGSSEMQREKLERAGLKDCFSMILISGEEGIHKPEQAIFLRAIAEHDVSDCMMIGDDPVRDIAPARALGLRTAWVSQEPGDIHCDYKIQTINQLEEILKHA